MGSSSEGSNNGGQPGQTQNNSSSNGDTDANGASHHDNAVPDNSKVPKPKRLACMICRKRKLKCDGLRPSCSTCSRLGHMCAYDEQRRKSGPKRGYVKALEERLKQVETLLKTQDQSPNTATPAAAKGMPTLPIHAGPAQQPPDPTLRTTNLGLGGEWDGSPQQGAPMDDFSFNTNMGMNMNSVGGGDFTWEMIGLGLEEPLPPQETIDELHQVYFEKVHPSIPMIHKYRYLAAMNLAPNQRPPVCLRYAMWTMACSITDKYSDMKDLFYQRARKYVEADYIKGYGEQMISVAHCQTHILLSCYEMKMMYFPRAWINTGSAVRLAQMTGLHRMDGGGLDVKQCLPPPKDWTEREERRRTFWMAFCEDRYASIGTGWPMSIDEQDITSNLPSSEEAFNMSRPEQTLTIEEATGALGASKLSSFGSIVLMACLFGRNLVHLHRPDSDEQGSDLNGPFWKRHRQMDNIILNTSLSLPANLKLPEGINNPNVVFSNMSLHTSTICLHQAAIFKAEEHQLSASIGAESKVRCITAANEIAGMMRTISHMDLSTMNPFISFCLYVAARVFVQYLKSRPEDSQTTDSLRFLLSAMHALKRRNPLTESFLVQLDVDLEALSVRIPKLRNAFPRPGDSPDKGAVRGRDGAVCDDANGIQGIMKHRDDCHFMKAAAGDGGPQGEAPELPMDPTSNPQSDMQGLDTSNTNGFNSQSWLSADPSMSGMTPSSGGGMYDNKPGSASDNQGMSGTPDTGHSGGPTPNSATNGGRDVTGAGGSGGGSSGAGAGGNGVDGRSHLGPRPMNGATGGNSFQASPVSPPQPNMMGPGGGDMNGGGGHQQASFFGDPGGFNVSPPMHDQQNGFGMAAAAAAANGWGGMQNQAGMPQVGDGVLRALMNMGPMDAMDLSSWDQGNEGMRQ